MAAAIVFTTYTSEQIFVPQHRVEMVFGTMRPGFLRGVRTFLAPPHIEMRLEGSKELEKYLMEDDAAVEAVLRQVGGAAAFKDIDGHAVVVAHRAVVVARGTFNPRFNVDLRGIAGDPPCLTLRLAGTTDEVRFLMQDDAALTAVLALFRDGTTA